jgi:peptide/nickel transport system permease protein
LAKYLLNRLLQMILVLFIISILIFVTVRLSPSDPIASITKGKTVTPEVRQQLLESFHLDKPVIQQYFIWITGCLKLDFGESYQYRQSVSFLIGQRFSTTINLVILSTILAIILAIPIGVLSAVKMNSILDKTLSVITLIFVASPVFLTGIIFMMVFALKLHWFPTMGTGTFRHLVLPATAMAINMVALTSRITRTSMIEQLNSDYIMTATAKGIPRIRVIIVYALKNALIPVITITSLQIGGLLVGAVLVETVFAMGGLGDLLLTSVRNADYPIVQAITLLMVVVFMTLNMLVDVLYAVLDPRIRLK